MQVRNHQPRCQCPPRTTGNPLEKCTAMECVDNPDCPAGRSCVDNRCQNVCSFDGVCGANRWVPLYVLVSVMLAGRLQMSCFLPIAI